MKYLSLCSGIEAATVAWHGVGWEPVGFSEIDPFPSAVLAHHYPHVPNYGDMVKFKEWPDADVNVLVGGTPCQSFSVAGLRAGLTDPRGNLMLTFGAVADKYRPRWLVWENVPGVLSSNGGWDFGSFLGLLGELGYGFAYRVLDAQYVRTCEFSGAVPQRRRRVFVVGHLGDWRRAAAVLFDRESLSGNPAPSREKGEGVAGTTGSGIETSGSLYCGAPGKDAGAVGLIPVSIGIDEERNASIEHFGPLLRGGQGGTRKAVATWPPEIAPTLNAAFGDKVGLEDQHALNGGGLFTYGTTTVRHAVAFDARQTPVHDSHVSMPLGSKDRGHGESTNMQVRRLTPIECERLQGFPDNYTRIPWRGKAGEDCPDGPRYKALGNSMAVNVMQWIGQRIQAVDGLQCDQTTRHPAP